MKADIKNILVAVDFKEHTDLLTDYAASLSQKLSARLWFVHIAAPHPDFVGYEVGPQYIRDMRAEDLKDEHRHLQKLANEHGKKGLKTEALLMQGPTVQTLLDENTETAN
ncbi:MAG: universal stress protein [Owenweeksia sp.]|nr:universal stress protein [Owenweeksia sp.]